MNRKQRLISLTKIAKENVDLSSKDFSDYFIKNEEVKIGDKDSNNNSNIVSSIQDRLQNLGYTMRAGVDGVFGRQTEEAVKKFQNTNKLQETGKVDATTYLSLTSGTAIKNTEKKDTDVSNKPDESRETKGIEALTGRKVSRRKLYDDIFSNLKNRNLTIAIVANAEGESGLDYSIAGDCGSYASNKPQAINTSNKSRCCSFGLWQMNICGGLGSEFLARNGNPKTPEEKIEILTDYTKQVEFMCNYLKGKNIVNDREKSLSEMVEWFVKNVERPAKPGAAIAQRMQYAKSIDEEIPDTDSEKIKLLAYSRYKKLFKFSKLVN